MNAVAALEMAETIRNGILEMRNVLKDRKRARRATLVAAHIREVSTIVTQRLNGAEIESQGQDASATAELFRTAEIEGEKLAELLLHYVGAITDVGEAGAPMDGLATDAPEAR